MKRLGAFLVFIGVGSFILPLFGMQFRLIDLFGEGARMAAGGIAAGLGLLLLLIGVATHKSAARAPAAVPPRLPPTSGPPPLPPIQPPTACTSCGAPTSAHQSFCGTCGAPLRIAQAAPAVPSAPSLPAQTSAPATIYSPTPLSRIGRRHWPWMALLVALLIPGAGQAYNGRPVKAFFLLFLSVLVLPWLYSLYDAWAGARGIVASGGRMGKGGFVWVFLQGWLAFNVALLVALVLTIKGVLQ